jgi:hypothetical protein
MKEVKLLENYDICTFENQSQFIRYDWENMFINEVIFIEDDQKSDYNQVGYFHVIAFAINSITDNEVILRIAN